MNFKTFKDKWVEALRSGKYKQGREHLRAGDLYCCLGVAYDILHPKGWQQPASLTARYPAERCAIYTTHEDSSGMFVPPGLDAHTAMRLIRKNDEESSDFNEIADMIEEL